MQSLLYLFDAQGTDLLLHLASGFEFDSELQGTVDTHDQQQGAEEEDHAGKTVQEALAGFIAKVVGDQRQHHDAEDVGGEGDGYDEDGQRHVAEQRVVANDVEVEQAERFEGVSSVCRPAQASATSSLYCPICRITPVRAIG